MTLPPGLASALDAVVAAAPEGEIGVAVSGGGDSMALLLLLEEAAARAGRVVAAVTVDHGLRPESGGEAAAVAALCAGRGIAHATCRWGDWDGAGNLLDRARQARRALIADWARGRGIGAVALGHTLDDQAETVVLRLARGSGVDGLAGMAAVVRAEGILWLRPLLGVRRDGAPGLARDQGRGLGGGSEQPRPALRTRSRPRGAAGARGARHRA